VAPAATPAAVAIAPAPAPAKPAPAAAPAIKPAKVRVSPVAARLAEANGIDISQVVGSGTGGRIVKADVELAISQGAAKAGKRAANPFLRAPVDTAFSDVAMSPMRQVIGRRLLESKQQIPHFYVTEKIDVSALVALRQQLNAIDGVKVTFNDLVVKATALALLRHPSVNSTLEGNVIRQWHTADISIAVAIPDGLITPILRGAEALTISQISAGVKSLAQQAMAGTLAPEQYQGGSFTISNLGMYGIEEFNAIVNPPQAAILAVGGMKDEAVVRDGELVAGKTMRVTLSCDHRVVDGADAAAFVKELRELLETPSSLML
jgi:pyruvate dehydrogenase E2 component (dihydrolipoamide acetyltransferase)